MRGVISNKKTKTSPDPKVMSNPSMCLGPKTKQGYLKRKGFWLRHPTHASVTFARDVMLIPDAVALCGTYRYL